MPWDSGAANAFAQLQAACEDEGGPLGTMDMLIAVHAVAVGAVLIPNDQTFNNVKQRLALKD